MQNKMKKNSPHFQNLPKFVKLNCKLRSRTSMGPHTSLLPEPLTSFPTAAVIPCFVQYYNATSLKLSSTSPSSPSPPLHTHTSKTIMVNALHLSSYSSYIHILSSLMQPTPCMHLPVSIPRYTVPILPTSSSFASYDLSLHMGLCIQNPSLKFLTFVCKQICTLRARKSCKWSKLTIIILCKIILCYLRLYCRIIIADVAIT